MSVAGKLTRDGGLLFATRCSRMFAYGLLSVVLVLYLVYVDQGISLWFVLHLAVALLVWGGHAMTYPCAGGARSWTAPWSIARRNGAIKPRFSSSQATA